MKNELHFPIFNDLAFPPPHLTFGQLLNRMTERWASLSPPQREERLRRDIQRRVPVRFTLTDGDQVQKPS